MRKMQNSKLQIIKNAIQISGEYNKDFSEKDLALESQLSTEEVLELIQRNELKTFFSVTRKSKVKCPKCNSNVDVDCGSESYFCSECATEIHTDRVPLYSIGINRQEIEQFLIEYILNKFQEEGWNVRDSDENFFIIKKQQELIAFSLCINKNGLKDYFTLRGWGIEYNPQSFVIISTAFDKFISAYTDKDLKCVLVTIEDILKEGYLPSLVEQIKRRSQQFQKEKKAEKIVDIEFRKFGDLPKVLEQHEELIHNLPARALQKTQESSVKQGNQFGKDIVKILNLTVLRTKYASGGNEPDGIGIISKYERDKTLWYPIEIKTFKPDDEQKSFYPVKEVIRQIDKYSNSLESEELTKILRVPAFIAIAYDFDINSKEEKDLIETFQTKHNKKLILIPLKSIIRIFSLFFESTIFSIPTDLIEKWIVRNNYIDEQQVDNLFSELNKHNKLEFSDQMKTLRKKTKEQGK